MKSRICLSVALLVVGILALPAIADAQSAFHIPLTMTDAPSSRILRIGVHPAANYCIVPADNFFGYPELQLPPFPPEGQFEAYLTDPAGPPVTPCFDQGSPNDYRPLVAVGQIDTFRVKFQLDSGHTVLAISWPSGLSSVANSLRMVDVLTGGSLVDVNMLTTTNANVSDAVGANGGVFIILEVGSGTPSGTTFFTVPPETLITKDPVKLKYWKAVKRAKPGKPIIPPTWANLMSEVVVMGGFQPLSTESDEAGAMKIGTAYMFNAGGPGIAQKWKPVKDSAKVRAWARLTKWDFKKNLGKGANAIPKLIENKTFSHLQPHPDQARGFDSTLNAGDLKRKQMKGELKKIDPKKTKHRLFAELIAFKFNIAASQLGTTPAGLGELIVNIPGNTFNGMSLVDVSNALDPAMTYWQGVSQTFYDDLLSLVTQVNRAFPGSIADTLTWMEGGVLTLFGTVDISSVPFLLPGPTPPRMLARTTTETEDPEPELDDFYEFDDMDEAAPLAVKVYPSYPNPFNPATTIVFRLSEPAEVTLKVYNVLGQEVATLLQNEEMDEDIQRVQFDARDLASGIYFYRVSGRSIEGTGEVQPISGKLLLVK